MIKNKLSVFINVLAVLSIIHALRQLLYLSYPERYFLLLNHLPENFVRVRYLFSVLLRALLLLAGLGVLSRREASRKLLIYICLVSAALVYWRHPIPTFRYIVTTMAGQGVLPSVFMQNQNLMVGILVACSYFYTVAPAMFYVYFFTQPNVKKQFVKLAPKVAEAG